MNAWPNVKISVFDNQHSIWIACLTRLRDTIALFQHFLCTYSWAHSIMLQYCMELKQNFHNLTRTQGRYGSFSSFFRSKRVKETQPQSERKINSLPVAISRCCFIKFSIQTWKLIRISTNTGKLLKCSWQQKSVCVCVSGWALMICSVGCQRIFEMKASAISKGREKNEGNLQCIFFLFHPLSPFLPLSLYLPRIECLTN